MLARSHKKPCRSPVARALMNVERLGFPRDCFDSAVATFLLCSVEQPQQGLTELKRVIKPEGYILLLEHVRPGNTLLGALFDALNPIIVRLWGANINRNTIYNVREAGLHIEHEINLLGNIVKLLICRRSDLTST